MKPSAGACLQPNEDWEGACSRPDTSGFLTPSGSAPLPCAVAPSAAGLSGLPASPPPPLPLASRPLSWSLLLSGSLSLSFLPSRSRSLSSLPPPVLVCIPPVGGARPVLWTSACPVQAPSCQCECCLCPCSCSWASLPSYPCSSRGSCSFAALFRGCLLCSCQQDCALFCDLDPCLCLRAYRSQAAFQGIEPST